MGDQTGEDAKGNSKKGYRDNIEELTLNNTDFRRVLYTGENIQLVLMTLQPARRSAPRSMTTRTSSSASRAARARC
jgi:hypothetical protein